MSPVSLPILVPSVILLVVALVASRVLSLTGPCSAPGCTRTAWWRVFLVVRGDVGVTPDPLVRLPWPARVCSTHRAELLKGDKRPPRENRKAIARAVVKVHRERPNWDRTVLDFEHVVAAKLRRL